ncbi:LysR family transcriptional regulator [Vibrio sp. vnigr-6D03]|uniref:LysR family transcriptional regulator n=1 Tax=Vibrio sp. vnigr-6D03 TaxID=2058088 RepID=UPI000C3334E5|nr:LysR family transcriptional regulator [Vibrio sp. vnigr-6D03]PKF77636.1 LysR family transcriptional regulator [Vibrio sp. vnigr-6D03]
MDKLTAARVFVDLSITASFTSTAERLDMSRPMVTRYIESMEDWLETRLFHRTTRKVSLTTAGEQCLPKIESWIENAEDLRLEMKSTGELSGKIRIATSMSFGHSQLLSALIPFLKRHPDVSIDVELQDTVANLTENQVDLAIRIASNPDPSLMGKPIAKCASVIVASPEYLSDSPKILHPKDLALHQCVGYRNFQRHVWHLHKRGLTESVEINSRLTANEVTALTQAALQGFGLALQPTYLVNSYISEGKLVPVLPDWAPSELTIYALYSSRRHQLPSVRALIDHLAQFFSENRW